MIELHRLNGSTFYLNCNQIEYMEETPDTIVHLLNDKTYVIKESAEEVIDRIVDYNRQLVGKKN